MALSSQQPVSKQRKFLVLFLSIVSQIESQSLVTQTRTNQIFIKVHDLNLEKIKMNRLKILLQFLLRKLLIAGGRVLVLHMFRIRCPCPIACASKMTLCLFSYGGRSPAEDVELFLRDGKIFNPKIDFFPPYFLVAAENEIYLHKLQAKRFVFPASSSRVVVKL